MASEGWFEEDAPQGISAEKPVIDGASNQDLLDSWMTLMPNGVTAAELANPPLDDPDYIARRDAEAARIGRLAVAIEPPGNEWDDEPFEPAPIDEQREIAGYIAGLLLEPEPGDHEPGATGSGPEPGPDPGPEPDWAGVAGPASSEPHSDLIVSVVDYRQRAPATVPWICYPFAYLGGVSVLAGPPKAGKSTLVGGLIRCRETGTKFLGRWEVPKGPTLLVTEESGVAVVHKTEGLTVLDILDRRSTTAAGLSFGQVLETIAMWGRSHPQGLVIIDTLAIWAGIKDENDAAEVTRALAPILALAQAEQLAIVLVHHARKSGGEDGEAIRGSGAILATVDIAIELSRVRPGSDERYLDVMGRVILPERFRLDFDRAPMTYTVTNETGSRLAEIEADLARIPADGPGLSRAELRVLWKKDPRKRIDQLMNVGRMRADFLKVGRTWANRYWSIPAAWTPGDRTDD